MNKLAISIILSTSFFNFNAAQANTNHNIQMQVDSNSESILERRSHNACVNRRTGKPKRC